MPSRHEAILAFAVTIVFVQAFDLLTWLLDRDVVTPFQIDAYRNARDGGALLLMWIAFVIAAPLGEEILFRGFLVRGWASKARDVVPGTIMISAIWALLHSQYDWYGILQIFILGLLIGWIRWRSGSTLLTIALHAVINAWSTVQTIIRVEWLN
jgi:membrane protease YdiL (CAAX protease family)